MTEICGVISWKRRRSSRGMLLDDDDDEFDDMHCNVSSCPSNLCLTPKSGWLYVPGSRFNAAHSPNFFAGPPTPRGLLAPRRLLISVGLIRVHICSKTLRISSFITQTITNFQHLDRRWRYLQHSVTLLVYFSLTFCSIQFGLYVHLRIYSTKRYCAISSSLVAHNQKKISGNQVVSSSLTLSNTKIRLGDTR